jgi:hypothetical protein
VNFVGKKERRQQSHGIGLRLRDELTSLAEQHGATLKIVGSPPGPPVLSSIVAEVYGRPDHAYDDLLAAGRIVAKRSDLFGARLVTHLWPRCLDSLHAVRHP